MRDSASVTEMLNGYSQEPGMGEYLCIGDYICLYCEETEGYVYSTQSSSSHNGLYLYNQQDRHKPNNIPNQHAVLFQVCIQNRYKLNKKHRKWLGAAEAEGMDIGLQMATTQTKVAASAEDNDNDSEQKRQHGKRVRYGEVLQLKHVFTGKFIHMSTTQTSQRDKNNMMVSLHEYNAKNAQFRILPRYKVKSEGEVVQLLDQIVFESVKSPGHYYHASDSFQIDHFTHGSELNLGVERASFTLIGCYRDTREQERFVRGGSVIRLFHKELEAYLVSEGLFDECVSEDVHFRIRVIDQHHPKSLSPSTSGITYFQIEAEHSILDGDVLRWEQQVRFRHLVTRQYLCIDEKLEVALVAERSDPRTVFRLHSVIKERDEIQFESYARIEHMLSGSWVHALKDEDYERHQFDDSNNQKSMQGLRWDGASARKVSATNESMYDDAFTLQRVEPRDISNFNYVAGMVPFLFNFIKDRSTGAPLNGRKTHSVIMALKDIKAFILPSGRPNKDRQKLLRNLRMIDLLVRILQFPLHDGDDESHIIRIFKESYDVLHAYMVGKSRKNALYIAKYIDFFQTQFTQKGGIGLNVAQMIVELIRDKRKIVDRINQSHTDTFIELLRTNKNYRFLDLLHVLCVCGGVSIPNNQSYIVQQVLKTHKDSIYLMERGQNINKRPNIVYVSVDGGTSWIPMHTFVDPTSADFIEEKYEFLIHQLDLFKALCFGRNDYAIHVITRELGYLTWEDAFLCLQSEMLPDSIRAKFCELIIALFVDVGNNYAVLDNPNICFVYEYVGSKDSERGESEYAVKDLVTIFPVLRDWLAAFLNNNCGMTASVIGHNLLVEQVLRLLQHLVKFGYYMDIEDVRQLLMPLLGLLDGRSDVPFPKDKSKGYTKESQKAVNLYRTNVRYEVSPESKAVVNAKYQAMEVLDFLLTYQRNTRLKAFITKFKSSEQQILMKKRIQSFIEPLLYETYNPQDQSKKALKKQKEVLRELRDMFLVSAIFDIENTTAILLDLSNYKYDEIVIKSLDILNKMYSSQSDVFSLAIEAQVLLTHDSARVHREVQRSMPVLRRLSRAKLNDQQVELMSEILDELAEFCHLPKTPDEPHHMNQNIMLSHGLLNIVLDILSQDIDSKLTDQYKGVTIIFKKTLHLMKLLIRENDKVQNRIFGNLDTLLDVHVVESDLAVALKEVFIANQVTCLKVHSKQIQKIVLLASEHQHRAPEFLDLLKVLVKVEGLDLTLKRNQLLVMKYIMQNFKKVAYILEQPREMRETVLTNKLDNGHLTFFISLVDLLAACAEGENKFIESICQTILPVDELMWVLNHEAIDNNIKKPFVKFMLWVYMKTAGNMVESGAADLQHDKSMWDFISSVTKDLTELAGSLGRHPDRNSVLLKTVPLKGSVSKSNDPQSLTHATLHLFLDGVMQFLEVFYAGFYAPDRDVYPNEIYYTDSLANALIVFCDTMGPQLTNPTHMKTMVACLTTVVSASSVPKSYLVSVLEKFSNEMEFEDTKSAVRRGNMEYYAAEIELNAKLRTFATNCSVVHCGHNTVYAQIKYKSKQEYTELAGNEVLPLGEQFQSLVRCFINQHEKKPAKRYAPAQKLLEQLAISANRHRLLKPSTPTDEDLDVRCLQLLRAIIHNEERKLPEDWTTRTSEPKIQKQLDNITEIQNVLNSYNLIDKVLPHLARRSDNIAREVLAFIGIMLFNANRQVQSSLLNYFLSTKEEVFFMAVRDRMQASTNSIKEKRSLLTQHDARIKEIVSNFKSYQTTITVGRKAMQQIQAYENKMKKDKMMGWRALSRAKEPTLDMKVKRKKSWKKKATLESRKLKKLNALSNGLSKDNEALMSESQLELMDIKREVFEGSSSKRPVIVDKIPLPDKMDPIAIQSEWDETEETVTPAISWERANISFDDKWKQRPLSMQSASISSESNITMNGSKYDLPILKSYNSLERSGDKNSLLKEPIMNEVCFTNDILQDLTVDEAIATIDEGLTDMLEYKDDGYIELVLKLLARVCDGQHQGLQDYLREQPDNVKSFNIVGETAQFLNIVYSSINGKTIDLVIQLFSTLNEFCSGNQENRSVIYERKIIDYINFILRAGEFSDCPQEKVLELRKNIAVLTISLIEENGTAALQVAKGVKDTLDKDAVFRCMTECYDLHQAEKTKLEDVVKMSDGKYLESAKTIASFGGSILQGVVKGKKKNALKDAIMDVGFSFYLILARLYDTDPHLQSVLAPTITPDRVRAFNYYKKNSLSIEVVKEDVLQKVNFRVKNKGVLRDEVKEKLKWNVDRSSPTNKIRDLMTWTRDVRKDISYQKRILRNNIAIFFTKGWLLWNHGVTLLSLAINVLMLATWDAKVSMEDFQKANATFDPVAIDDPIPKIVLIKESEYQIAIYALGGVHNVLSLFVIISYFLSNQPRLPNCSNIRNMCRKREDGNYEDESANQEESRGSKLEVQFFSFVTFFYLLFLVTSIAGTMFHGYFFAFHLFNIVNNNQLLSGVIKAVTQNGVSLLWVGVLGLVVIYLYALGGFALLRSSFSPGDHLYCASLWQCSITVLRYGLIGDMFQDIKQNEQEDTFAHFWPIVLYHVSFFIFITTIGLNIIFGIIVDTFSELRDLKWRAESDMKDTCFICSRNSYDFEHHGKGFDHHVRFEHNMWAYIYFMIHLDDVQSSDYTALELHVYKLLQSENYDFFPLNRALCLSCMDQDSTQSKIDDLLQHVTSIVHKQKEEEADRKRKVEKIKQKKWQEKHRRFVFGNNTPDVDQEREPLIPPSRPLSAEGSLISGLRRGDSRDSDTGPSQSDYTQSPGTVPRPLPKTQAKSDHDYVPRDVTGDDDIMSDSDSDSMYLIGRYDVMQEVQPPVRDPLTVAIRPVPDDGRETHDEEDTDEMGLRMTKL